MNASNMKSGAFAAATTASMGGLLFLLVHFGYVDQVKAKAAQPQPSPGSARTVTFTAPTPTPVAIFWLDTAGNIGMRGVEAVVPGKPDAKAKLSDSCRAAAEKNGEGTLTICTNVEVGKVLAGKLGGI